MREPIALGLAACRGEDEGGPAIAQTLESMVTGAEKIHCEGCEQRIGNALRRLSGIQDVRASFRTQQVSVAIDPAWVNDEQVRSLSFVCDRYDAG